MLLDVLPVSRSPRFFGEADTAVVDILLSDLNCLGSEPDLLTCSERPSSTKSYCDHSEDAGVKCGGELPFYRYVQTCNRN